MCIRCKAHPRRYLVKDELTGLIVCEECGFASQALTETAYESGTYIWEVNPAWPAFSSFEDLIRKILIGDDVLLPPCSLMTPIPSRILTRIFDLLNERLAPDARNGRILH